MGHYQYLGRGANGKPRLRYRSSATSYNAIGRVDQVLRAWDYAIGDADEELQELDELRAKSYDLIRKDPLALGAVNTWVTHTIGTGLELQCRIDRDLLGLDDDQADEWEERTEGRFRMYAEDHTECDVERTKNFYDHQVLAYTTEQAAGDALTLMPFVERRNSPFRMRLQSIDPARVRNSNFAPDTVRLAGGIERDGVGAPIFAHVMRNHPHTSKVDGLSYTWSRIPFFGRVSGRQNLIHLKVETRSGQTRGIPLLAVIMRPLKQMGIHADSHVVASIINSYFSVFLEGGDGATLDHGEDDEDVEYLESTNEIALGPATVHELGNGQKVQIADAKRPAEAFDAFVMSLYRTMGAGLGIPLEIWLKAFQSSYSAARGAMLEFWKGVQKSRKHTALHFCQPVYANWLAEEVARGNIEAPGFFTDPLRRMAWCRAAWIGPPRGQIDPAKETKAERDMWDMRVKPLADICTQLTGNDWDSNIERIARELRKLERLKVPIETAAAAAAAVPDAEDPDQTDEQERPTGILNGSALSLQS